MFLGTAALALAFGPVGAARVEKSFGPPSELGNRTVLQAAVHSSSLGKERSLHLTGASRGT